MENTKQYFDDAMGFCHREGYKVKRIVEYLTSHGIIVDEQTAINMFTDYLNRKYKIV